MIETGRGGAKADEAQAVELYKLGCSESTPIGCRELGRMYENGLGGLGADENMAMKYYRMACDGDEASACTALGELARAAH
jgi:TPR repeat protein